MTPSFPQLLVIIAIVVIVIIIFGSKNIRNLGSDLGGFIKGFRNAVKDDKKSADEETEAKTDQEPSETKS